MSFNPYINMQVRPLEKWYAHQPNGDRVFTDPFVSEAELMTSPDLQGFDPIELDPNMPPPIFDAHPTYQNGFDFFRNIDVLNKALQIAVLLTGSEVAGDVGDLGMFEAMIAESDVVILGQSRGVIAEEIGRLSLPEGAMYQKAYTDHILEVAASYRKPIRLLDPMVGSWDGLENMGHPPIDNLLYKMSNKIVEQSRGNLGPDQYVGADLAYRNQKQWQIAGKIGDILFEAHNEMELNDFATVILPAEFLDVPRRFVALGMSEDDIGSDFADVALRNEEAQRDGLIFQNGRISANGFGV